MRISAWVILTITKCKVLAEYPNVYAVRKRRIGRGYSRSIGIVFMRAYAVQVRSLPQLNQDKKGMKKEEKLKAIRKMVRNLGEVSKWEENGKKYEMTEVILVNVLLHLDDIYTNVKINHFGQLYVGGCDGINSDWSENANKLCAKDIDRIYKGMLEHDKWIKEEAKNN